MQRGKIKHLFPGGNTSVGFFSYYGDILNQEEADRLFVIKGGPGVGKSTFMKKIGEAMLQKGYDVEFLHCSSDNNSLDGVKIPVLKIAFIDGTAPHVVDPKSPGAVDEILNFGDFWDDQGIRVHKNEIIKTTGEIGSLFARAYKYLKAAFSVYEDSAAIHSLSANLGAVNVFADGLITELFDGLGVQEKYGRQRSLFASAITPKGLCNHLDSILTTGKVYEIVGGMGTGEDKILEKVKAAALERGYFVEAYFCALNPYKLEHIVIPALDTAITTSNPSHTSTVKKYASANMLQFSSPEVLTAHREDLEQNKGEFDRLMTIALETIGRAKALHDHLETFYVPNINFKAIDEFFEKMLSRLG